MYVSSQLAAIGGKQYNNYIETAEVTKDGYFVNPQFESRLNETEKAFLEDHEMLHLIFKHHSRFPKATELENAGADLAINSILYQKYVGNWNPKDIIPTLYAGGLFPQKFNLPENMPTDWYISALQSKQLYHTVQSGFGGQLGPGKDLESVLAGIEAGIEAGIGWGKQIRHEMKSLKNRKFNEFVKELVGYATAYSGYGLVERFGYNRRQHDNLLPSFRYSEGDTKIRKNKVILYLDYSGSCMSLKPIIEKAAASIPHNFYKIETYLFADRIGRSDDEIGNGTSYYELYNHAFVYNYDQAWVFTDGHGSDIDIPEANRKKWHWFLIGDTYPPSLECIPKGCNIHFLEHFII